MQAITTKYLPATNSKGARIKATTSGLHVTILYPYELSGEAIHRQAADFLCTKYGWKGRLVGGAIKDGYVFVFDTGFNPVAYKARELAALWDSRPLFSARIEVVTRELREALRGLT